jgi:hypothetical protein
LVSAFVVFVDHDWFTSFGAHSIELSQSPHLLTASNHEIQRHICFDSFGDVLRSSMRIQRTKSANQIALNHWIGEAFGGGAVLHRS